MTDAADPPASVVRDWSAYLGVIAAAGSDGLSLRTACRASNAWRLLSTTRRAAVLRAMQTDGVISLRITPAHRRPTGTDWTHGVHMTATGRAARPLPLIRRP